MRISVADSDTIAAIATPLGEGGLAVLRVSGDDAIAIGDRVFTPPTGRHGTLAAAASHTLHYGYLVHRDRRIDEVMASVMRAPRTFTRQDVVEFSCHGGVFVAREALDALLAAGARLATPGEFTRRAFLNGRMDLTQAEAVIDVIHARTELSLAAANEQLAGSLSRRMNGLRDALLATLAHVEAHIDFPDEDIAPDTQAVLLERIQGAIRDMDQLLATAREGQALRRGVRIAIVGRPNAGKSSLLNQLLQRDRAIVSAIPGTTRDTIEETANLRGIPVVFVDTAGLRSAQDPIEQEGIRRTQQAADCAELILHVMDRSEPFAEADARYLAEFAGRPRLLILNKADLPEKLTLPAGVDDRTIAVSCATGSGLERMKEAIAEQIRAGFIGAGMHEVMINTRHEDALRRSRVGAVAAATSLQEGAPLELTASDLRIAVQAVGEIVGSTTTEDLLDSIFSQFCLGK